MHFRKLLRVPVSQFVTFFSPRFRGTRPSLTAWRTTATKGPNGNQNGDIEAVKQQQLNDVYDLGRMKLDLKMMINDDTITTLSEQDCGLAVYKEYQELASKYNIILQDPPLGKKIDREEKQAFFSQQIKLVEKHISENKPNNIWCLYNAAPKVEKTRRILELSNDKGHLMKHFKGLKEDAQKLGTDINDELNQLENSFNTDTGCIHRIKTKLCEVRQTVRRSEIDRTRIITNEHWAVSLARLPFTFHSHHAFLVLEGKTDDKSMIWFADFVSNDVGRSQGRVRIESYESEQEVGAPVELLYRCDKNMMKVSKRSRLRHSTWSIPKQTADLLIANLKKQQKNPPKYNILGNTALANRGGSHNCFTFAKMMLHDLNKGYIHVPGDKVKEWIGSAAVIRAPPNKFFFHLYATGLRLGLGLGILTSHIYI